ncbi:sugar transporter [Dactylonectria estremocensis]|uniref:Sugar transporter n=1 Tax=Dactylonectria estremocensis TaxID=1079267 RepID=A0A9P9IE38_9HYPO|nr:sugar transporter [Dactylonectria estremocensis]
MLSRVRTQSKAKHATGEDLARVLPEDGIPWHKKSHLVWLCYYGISLSLLTAANGYDGSLMNGLLALPQWVEFMDNPRGSWLGFISASQALSSAVAYPVVAYFGNRWGRKKGLYIGYFFLLVGAFLQAFTPNTAGFIIARFLIGQPSAWWSCLAPLLITELAYPTHRAFFTALFNCGWYVGSSFAAWVTFGTRNYDNDWSWRIPSLMQIAIPIIVLPAAIWVPESPRYLVSKGQTTQGRAILTTYHAGGDENSLLVDFEMAEIEHAIEADSAAAKNTSWMVLFSTKSNRHPAFISISLGIFAQWVGNNVVSYYLAIILDSIGITSVTSQTLISGGLQIWNLILAVSAAASVDLFGRRPLFLTSCVGMLISFIIITALSGNFAATGNSAVGVAVVPLLFIYYGFFDIAFTPLLIAYVAEIWPYELRARGLAMMSMVTYGAVFFNVFVNPIALDAIAWKYYILFAVVLLVATLTIYFFYPETKGHSLEEMAVIFDGEDAAVIAEVKGTNIKGGDVLHEEHV